jgi:hypothetical protein
MNGVTLSLAYKYVALALMLAEVNFFAGKVGLKTDHPVTEQEVRAGSHVGPPSTNDFGGSILTDAYFFGFGWGHLANFHRNDFRSDSSATVKERNIRLSKMPSLIDTNGASELATAWLGAVGVDVAALEMKYKRRVTQWRCPPQGLSQGPTMLPVYQVEWRGSPFKSPRRPTDMAVVTITILGSTKELIEFHILDDTLFLRPRITINGQQKLLAIPDAEFQGFDPLQRSNLVIQSTEQATETSPPAGRPAQ